MKESYWMIFIVMLGVITIVLINLFQTLTNTDEHNYNLLKETTEAAMYDALDWSVYSENGEITINREKFVENFVRRFAENANLSRDYRIQIYDVNESPPKVSLQITSKGLSASDQFSLNGKTITFQLSNRLDAIMETKEK